MYIVYTFVFMSNKIVSYLILSYIKGTSPVITLENSYGQREKD